MWDFNQCDSNQNSKTKRNVKECYRRKAYFNQNNPFFFYLQLNRKLFKFCFKKGNSFSQLKVYTFLSSIKMY